MAKMAKNSQKNRAYVIYGWSLREQRTELESKKDLYVAQSRCLKDEVSTIKSEIRERKDRIEKLKIRHEHTVKAMGETKKVRKNVMHLGNLFDHEYPKPL
jgi:chromosome segregation ATPase